MLSTHKALIKHKWNKIINLISGPHLPLFFFPKRKTNALTTEEWTRFWNAYRDVQTKRWIRHIHPNATDKSKYDQIFIQSLKNLSDSALRLVDEIKSE